MSLAFDILFVSIELCKGMVAPSIWEYKYAWVKWMKLQDKVIVITGGAQGLGFAMAEKIGSQGAQIVLLDRNIQQLTPAVDRLKTLGVRSRPFVVDVTHEESVSETFEEITAEFGGVDALINNAGILKDGLLLKVNEGKVKQKMNLSDWQAVIDVKLTGVFLCGREAATQMVESGRKGVIINMSSVARFGNMGQTNYAAAKAGVVAMTVTWARELGRYGIRVCAIAPGVIRTAMTDAMKPVMRDRLEAMTQVNRLGEPEEIAHTAQFLLENEFITGRVIEVDGGISM